MGLTGATGTQIHMGLTTGMAIIAIAKTGLIT